MLLVVRFKHVLNENKLVVLLLNIHKMGHHLQDLVHFVKHQLLNGLSIHKVQLLLVCFPILF
jgi:hypothetical protein